MTDGGRSRAVVLVVDDSATQARRSAEALEAAGFRVQLAADGRAALERARRWRPDVIVSDILMPVMDGFALCREVRRDPQLGAVPLVLYTATYLDPKDEEFALGLGATRFVVKPADPADLVREVRGALARGHAPPAAPAPPADDEFLRGYSERLAAKLEEKLAELELANGRLRETNARLETALAEVSTREATIRDQVEHLRLLNEFARTVGGTLDLDNIFAPLGEHVLRDLVPGARCSIAEYDAAADAFRIMGVWPPGAPTDLQPGSVVPGEGSVLRTVLRAAAPYLTQDTENDRHPNLRRLAAQGIRSMIAVPLVIDGAVWGTLQVGFTEQGAATPASVDLLAGIAAHLAVAIQNARLYAELRRAHALVQAAHEQAVQQERLRALGQMAGGVAHDLNNALAPVVGFTELLLESDEALRDPAKMRCYLELIRTGAGDAAAVVGRLREFYRQRSQGESFCEVDLRRVVEESVALTQPKWKGQAQAEGKTIRVVVATGGVPPVVGNEAELRELLTNLIFNAVDAMPEGGTITVRTRQDDSAPAGAAPHVVLEVSDTGVGMSKEVRARCLEPFFTTKGEQGTGLGLAMVHGIVQRHGGGVSIDSAPGEGTTFRISLPVESVEEARAGSSGRDAAAHDPARGQLRALVVDDDPGVLAVTQALLAADGHTVESATSGPQALQMFRPGRFDVVVTDRAMPGMGGDQLAAAIKTVSPMTPVLLVSGFGDLMAATGERPPCVDGVLGKPVTIARLRAALAALPALAGWPSNGVTDALPTGALP